MTFTFLKYLLILSLFTGIWEKFNKISITNRIKSSAETYYDKKDYANAALCYDSLISIFQIEDENVHLNLAHCYFKQEDRKRAAVHYQLLSKSADIEISSIAYQQMGLISTMKGKTDEAITLFKKSLITNPENQIARYNLELVKKLKKLEMEANQQASKKGSGKDKDNHVGKGKGNKSVEGSKNKVSDSGSKSANMGNQENDGEFLNESDSGNKSKNRSNDESDGNESELKQDEKGNKQEQAMRTKRLSEMKLSQEKARLILEEMRNEEVQYLQQLKKYYTNKKYEGKPDW